MKKADLDLYADCLLGALGAKPAALAAREDTAGHGPVTRFIPLLQHMAKNLGEQAKQPAGPGEQGEEILVFNGALQENAETGKGDWMRWHFDHCSGNGARGINLFNAPCCCAAAWTPVAFGLMKKPFQYGDVGSKRNKPVSEGIKTRVGREMTKACLRNALKLRCVPMENWFLLKANIIYSPGNKRYFSAALEGSRLPALGEGYSAANMYRVRRGLIRGHGGSAATCRKPGATEAVHTPLKCNVHLLQASMQTLRKQGSCIFRAICATFELECLRIANRLNSFALCRKPCIHAPCPAHAELQLFSVAA